MIDCKALFINILFIKVKSDWSLGFLYFILFIHFTNQSQFPSIPSSPFPYVIHSSKRVRPLTWGVNKADWPIQSRQDQDLPTIKVEQGIPPFGMGFKTPDHPSIRA